MKFENRKKIAKLVIYGVAFYVFLPAIVTANDVPETSTDIIQNDSTQEQNLTILENPEQDKQEPKIAESTPVTPTKLTPIKLTPKDQTTKTQTDNNSTPVETTAVEESTVDGLTSLNSNIETNPVNVETNPVDVEKNPVLEKPSYDLSYNVDLKFLASRRALIIAGLVTNIVGFSSYFISLGVLRATQDGIPALGVLFGGQGVITTGYVLANMAKRSVFQAVSKTPGNHIPSNKFFAIAAPVVKVVGISTISIGAALADRFVTENGLTSIITTGAVLLLIGEIYTLISSANSLKYIRRVQRQQLVTKAEMKPLLNASNRSAGMQLSFSF